MAEITDTQKHFIINTLTNIRLNIQSDTTRLENSIFNPHLEYSESSLEPTTKDDKNMRVVTGKIAMSIAVDKLEQYDNDLHKLNNLLQIVMKSNGMLSSLTIDKLRDEFNIISFDPIEEIDDQSYREWEEYVSDSIRQTLGYTLQVLDLKAVKVYPKKLYEDGWAAEEVIDLIVNANPNPKGIKRHEEYTGRVPDKIDIPQQPKDAPRIGEYLICLDNKNFQEGQYEIMEGGIGVSRKDAKKLKKAVLAKVLEEGTYINCGFFVTSYMSGSGHFVIAVPERNTRKW